ncbi:MAG: ABC transporter ATP-binding protein/permease [Lachnospiraceae bacterium]|nr:ABC transporter ATP-binding protein/permease [Lachnospiraceae bacterium]
MYKLMRYLRHYKKETVIGPLFKLLESSFELIVPLVMARIIDVGIKNNDLTYILKLGVLLVILGVLGLSCSLTAQYFAAKAATGFGTELRHDLFAHIQSFSYSEIDKAGSATLVTRITSDINQAQAGVNLVIRLFLRSPFIVVGALVMAFTINVKLALIFCVTVPVLSLVIYGIMAATIPLYRKVQKSLDEVLLATRENLTGIRVIRAFCMQQKEKEEFEEKSSAFLALQILVGKISALMNPVTYIIVNAATIAIVWGGGLQVNEGAITQGEVIALVNYMTQILLALVALANLIVTFTKAMASGIRINEVFDLKPSMVSGEKKEMKKEEVILEMSGVDFAYQGHKEAALSDLNVVVKKGETIGIIGGTGSGKTTFVNLIPRFYDASKGRVKVNGVDVKDYDLGTLRGKIGIVPQKAVLFRGTIRENLLMGNAYATEEDMIQALKNAQAYEIVMNKSAGMDTMVSEGGKNLSGGQKQRLTIARALVRKPEILILDDSASALDYATDAKLRQAIAQNTENMTVFIVSQRVASIMQADKIIVLDDGKIAGMGTHAELIQGCEIYREICHSQLSKEEVAYETK